MPATPFDWDSIIADFAKYLVAIGRPRTTIRLRKYQIEHMAACVNRRLTSITYDDIVEYFSVQTWKPATRSSARCGIRVFFAWACKTGRIANNPAEELERIRREADIARPVPEGIFNEALLAADTRVVLMLRLAGHAGLRRAEVARVRTQDLRMTASGPQLLVHGKGNKDRLIPISDGLADLIALGPRGHTPGAPTSGWLFPSSHGGHLTPQWVAAQCSALMPEPWSMHTLRHRFATKAYQSSRNVRAVQYLLGHASLATTQRYLGLEDHEVRAAMMGAA